MNAQFYYGINNKKEDVTAKATLQFCFENCVKIDQGVSLNSIFGDVAPGLRKTLTIKFPDDHTTLELPEIRTKTYILTCPEEKRTARTQPLNLCALLQIDKIFLLNLGSRNDRLEQSKLEFKKLCISDSQWERFEAYRGDDVDVQQRFAKEYAIFCAKQPQSRATNGAFGCLLSHCEIIKTAKRRGYKRVLIFEDDFEPTSSFDNEQVFEAIGKMNFDMFYFSTTTMLPPLATENINFVRVQRAFAAGAYIVNNSIFDVIIDQSLNYGLEIDVFYADVIQKHYNAYSLPKSVVVQREGFSDIQKQHVKYQF